MRKKWSVIFVLIMVLIMASFATETVSAATMTVSGTTSITIKGDTVKMTATSGRAITGYTLTKGGSTIESRSYSATSYTGSSSPTVSVSFASKVAGSYVLKVTTDKITVKTTLVSGQGYVTRYVFEGRPSTYTVYITNQSGGSSGGGSGSGSSGSCLYGHTYSNACDKSCNKCGATRSVTHSYSGNCDEYCNVCSASRSTVYSHTYSDVCDQTCNVCSTTRKAAHSYTNNCEKYCNLCNTLRTPPHDFSAACDGVCDSCGEERYTYSDHEYYNDCDMTCDNCGTERTAPHDYDYYCSVYCSDCGYQRVPEYEHDFYYVCSTECSDCGFKRKAKHIYDNACDEDCNECYEERNIKHKYSIERNNTPATFEDDGLYWFACKVCGNESSDKIAYRIDKISLSKKSYTYDGKVKSPTVVVKDRKGQKIDSKYYTITKASGRKNVGKYSYTIKFKGRYSGTKKVTFTITPKETSVKKLKASKKAFTVELNKVTKQVTGYEVMYATNSKFTKGKKTVNITSYKTTSKKISGLSAKKTYYVKVRTYKTVSGKKYYSDWSKVSKVKTK